MKSDEEWPAEIEELYQIAASDACLDKSRLPLKYQPSSVAAPAAAAAASSSSAAAPIAPIYWDTVNK